MYDDFYQMYLEELEAVAEAGPEEELSLLERLAAGDVSARERLIEGNLKRVLEYAKEYDGRGLPMGDLVQEGNMALTALAGPAANFLTALAATAVASLIYHIAPLHPVWVAVLCLLSNLALLGVGMGLFNLIPISPLDGSKILFALLPDRAYYTILRYEKYVMGVLIVLVLLGVFDRPLSFLMLHVLQAFCAVTGMPMGALLVFQDAASIFQLF